MGKYVNKILLVILVFAALNCRIVNAAENDDIKVSVQVGIDNFYKIGFPVPVVVEVTNNKQDINGVIRLEVPSRVYSPVIFSTTISIPKGTTKKYTFAPYFNSTNGNNLEISIFNGNEELYKDSIQVKVGQDWGTYNVGILSDDFESVKYFMNPARITNCIKLDEKSFPDNLDTVKMFDAILINNFDTSRLSREQYDILSSWVQDGGLLIIGTGPLYAKTLAIFKEGFISGQIGDLQDIETYGLSRYIDVQNPSPMKLSILSMDVKESMPLIYDDKYTLVYLLERGSGKIVISTFDFGLKPVVDWKGKTELASRIIGGFPGSQNVKGIFEHFNDYENIKRALKIIPDLSSPDIANFLIIAILYLTITGPISYLVLKKLDKREMMWFTVPILSLVFSVSIYLTGFETRFDKPVANIISVINDTSGGTMNVHSYTGVSTPYTGYARIESGDGAEIKPLDNISITTYKNRENKVAVTTSPMASIEYCMEEIWDMETVGIEKSQPIKGSLYSELNFVDNSFAGSLKNNTGMDFDECYIVAPDYYAEIGPVKNGENINIAERASNYAVQGGLASALDKRKTSAPQVNGLSNEQIYELVSEQQKTLLINSLFTVEGFTADKVKIIAISSTPVYKDVKVNGNAANKYERSILVSDAVVTFKKGKTVEYPFGFINAFSALSAFKSYDQTTAKYSGKGSLELSYKIDSSVKPEIVKFQYDSSIKFGTSENSVKEYIWNFTTNMWDLKARDSSAIDTVGMPQYMSRDNVIRYKVQSDDDSFSMKLPRIYVKGSAR